MMRLAILSLCVLALGCCPVMPSYNSNIKMHMINIDRNGSFVPYSEDQDIDFTANEKKNRKILLELRVLIERWKKSKDTDYELREEIKQEIGSKLKEIKEDYDDFLGNLVNTIKAQKPNENGEIEILIYVHGGLNEEACSIDRVNKQFNLIRDDTKQYPIFINWYSGGGDSYQEHLWSIRQGKEEKYAWVTSPFYLLGDVLGSIGYAPKSWGVQGTHALRSALGTDDRYKNIEKTPINYQLISLVDEDNQNTIDRTLYWWMTSPFKVITTPFVYTMSKPAWDIMSRRSNTMFRKPNEYGEMVINKKTLAKWQEQYSYGTGALSDFFSRLMYEQDENGLKLKITLYGHSMGVIVCNNIVDLFHELQFARIVHMASADSIRNLYDKTIPYLSKNTEAEYYSLHLAPINEDTEISGGGTLPSGSLLTWIDNSFTTPETELNRRAGRWNNIKRTLYRIPTILESRVHFKIFGFGKIDVAGPQKHGEFDNVPYWCEKIYWKKSTKAYNNECGKGFYNY